MSSTGGSSRDDGASQVSSSHAAQDNQKNHGEADDDDVLEQNRSVQDGVFTCMHLLTMTRGPVSLRISALKICLEALQCFLVVFNPSKGWIIQQDLWLWKAVSWVLYQIPVLEAGYGTQITVLYLLTAVVLGFAALTMYAAVLLRKDEQAYLEWKRLIRTLQFTAEWLFGVYYIATFSFLITLFDCSWPAFSNVNMLEFPDVQCLASPHIIHMLVALLTAVVFAGAALLLSVASCETNPCARALLASPHAIIRLKSLIVRLVAVLVCGLNCIPSIQSPIAMIGRAYVLWVHMSAMPYLSDWANHFQICVWSVLTYCSILWVVLLFSQDTDDPAFRYQITQDVLYGVWPVGVGFLGISILTLRYYMRPLARFRNAPPGAKPKEIHRFKSPQQVEALSRVLRKWDLDGVLDPEAADLGEFIMKCGLSQFPSNPFLMTLHSNFLIEVRKASGKARSQLMQCAKNNPTVIEQYFNFATEQLSKRMKDETGGASMDLLAYVEYSKTYRAVVRAHKIALQAQRRFWHELLRSEIKLEDLEAALRRMQSHEQTASRVYRRVLERYPKSGKLLRAYGKFLEEVQNDPLQANKCYCDAEKLGLEDSLIALTHTTDNDSKRAAFVSTLDDKTDGVIVISAQGNIMMVNQIAFSMFGYEKGELEGKNVSCLMPAPFAHNHNSYLSKFIGGAPGSLIQNLNDIVGLTKSREIVPVTLGVTHMVGEGQESVFMGVFKPYKETPNVVKMWVLPKSGSVLCVEHGFSDWFGKAAPELPGTSFATLGPDTDALIQLITAVTEFATAEEGAVATVMLGGDADGTKSKFRTSGVVTPGESSGSFKIRTRLHHKYADAVACELTAVPGPSKMELYIVIEIRLLEEQVPLLVVDGKGGVCYANHDLTNLLEYPHKQLLTMDLNELIPAPFAQLHKEWLSHAAGGRASTKGCRSGQTVNFVNASGALVPVKLSLSQHEVGDQVQHVVKVFRSSNDAAFSDKRLLLTIDVRGNCESVNDPTATVFGFPASALVGKNVTTFINGFAGFAEKFGQDEVTALLGALVERADNNPGMCWRVGVQAPRDKNQHSVDQASSLSSTFLSRRNREALKAAAMCLDIAGGETNGIDDEDPENTKVLMQLWRADLMTGVVEVDQNLMIMKADAMAGLIFGTSHQAMQRHLLGRYLQLPDGADEGDLMGKGPRGAMKGSKGLWKVGALKELDGRHFDRAPLGVSVQAVSRTGQATTRVVAKIAVSKPSMGGRDMFDNAMNETLLVGAFSDAKDKSLPKAVARAPAELVEATETAPADAAVSLLGPADLLRESEPDNRSASSGSGGSHQQQRKRATSQVSISHQRTKEWLTGAGDEGDATGGGHVGERFRQEHGPSRSAAHSPTLTVQSDVTSVHLEAEAAPDEVAAGPGRAESVGTAEVDHQGKDEDLTADFRRAKRLRKLRLLLTSNSAQAATSRFKSTTWTTLAIMLLVHVVCFAVFTTQIDSQHLYISQIDALGQAIDKENLITNRAVFIQGCRVFASQNTVTCAKNAAASKLAQLISYTPQLADIHRELYLGFGSNPTQFADAAVYDLWTNDVIQERDYLDIVNASRTINESTGVWELGNKFIQASRDLGFSFTMNPGIATLNTTRPFQFVVTNGPNILFSSYTQSLDMLVQFAWQTLGGLNTLLVLLLVLEALLIQLCCMAFELLSLQRARREALRTFGVCLTLPSALIRTMAVRPCKVDIDEDDDTNSDDGMDEQAAAEQQQEEAAAMVTSTSSKPVEKSVRMFVEHDDVDTTQQGSLGGSIFASAEVGGAGSTLVAKPRKSAGGGRNGRRKRSLESRIRQLFDYAFVSKYKVNGKSLIPSTVVLWKVMGPLVLWWASIITIYSITFTSLGNLQQPLGQLNIAQKVMYDASRVRGWAALTIFEVNATAKAIEKQSMLNDIATLRESYNTLTAGGPLNNPYLPNVYLTSSTFTNPGLAQMLYDSGTCLRVNQSLCLPPSSPYYQVTHSGINAMMLQFLEEATLLALDPLSATNPNSTRYTWIANVASTDLKEGFQTAAELLVTSAAARYDQVKMLHIILMATSGALLLAFIVLVFRPYLRKVREQAALVAAILSQLPPDVDIEGSIRGLLKLEMDASTDNKSE